NASAAVGLQRAARDERVGVLSERLTDEEFELADLVAGLQQSGEIVALDPELDAELCGQALQLEQRRWRIRELDTRDRRSRRSHSSHYLRERGRQASNPPAGRAAASASGRYAPDNRGCCC